MWNLLVHKTVLQSELVVSSGEIYHIWNDKREEQEMPTGVQYNLEWYLPWNKIKVERKTYQKDAKLQ